MEGKGWLALTLSAHGEEPWALLQEGRGRLTAASPAGTQRPAAALCLLASHPESGIGWLGPRRVSVEPKGTRDSQAVHWPCSTSRPCFGSFGGSCLEAARNWPWLGFSISVNFILLGYFGQMSLQAVVFASIGSFS